MSILVPLVALAAGFVIGLLVGRKNPGVANAAATFATMSKAEIAKAIKATKK